MADTETNENMSAKSSDKDKQRPASKTGSIASVKSKNSNQNAAKKKAGGGGKKGGKDKKKDAPPPEETIATSTEAKEALPPGCQAIFLASKTQEIFDIRLDENVTEENPHKFVNKTDILQDLFNRAAVSDFSPLKDVIREYPDEEILLVYDPDFKYGQNFFIALTVEAKEHILKPAHAESVAEGGVVKEEEVEDLSHVFYQPPVAKEWISYGSEMEIDMENVHDWHEKSKFIVRRKRKDFGAPVTFTDRGDTKDAYQECTSYEDKNFDLKRMEMDKGVQSVAGTADMAAQTDWKYPRNACTQYNYREMNEQQQKELFFSEDMKKFLKTSEPRFLLCLQQNHIMDVFTKDWENLGVDDDSVGSKSDNHLKEFQSFTDLQYSKEKMVTCIDWHPTIKGITAVSVAEKMTFDDRVDHADRIIMSPALILIWSFSDPIHPQLLLEAPDDIICFKFNPTNPDIVAGGCINGQLILWDISQHTEKLMAPRASRKKTSNAIPGFEDEYSLDNIIVRYCAVSCIEHSHKAAITDIQWVPDHFEVNKMGVPMENKSGECALIMTCATDNCVLFWDTRPNKGPQVSAPKKETSGQNISGIPQTFKHLDLVWKPLLRVHCYKSEPGGDHAPTCFSISESQKIKGGLDLLDDDKKEQSSAVKRDKSKTLNTIKTHFYIGTEDGEVVYLDWMPQKDQDTGKVQTPKPQYYHTLHAGPIVAMQRSPFFREIVLVVGGWSFALWKEGVVTGPLISSSSCHKRYTAASWSPTRPSVFFLTRIDGSVDIWDLLDRTHEPTMCQNITPCSVTYVCPHIVSKKQQLLAIGDSMGTVHILEVPWSLRYATPGEVSATQAFFEREEKRRAFVVTRWDMREQEKMEMEMEAKRKAGIAPAITLTDEEVDQRQKIEYEQYLKEETAFLRELGVIREDEPAIGP